MLEMAMRKAARMVLGGSVVKVARAHYDFSVHGGAISTISLVKTIPAHSTVIGIRTVELTAIAGTGTIQFKAGTTGLTAALNVAAFTGVDVHALSTVDGIKVAVESDLKFVIASNTITAGHLDIFVQYLEGNPAD